MVAVLDFVHQLNVDVFILDLLYFLLHPNSATVTIQTEGGDFVFVAKCYESILTCQRPKQLKISANTSNSNAI